MISGLGDRWLAGEHMDGVDFGPGDAVKVGSGRGSGGMGRVRLLLGPGPDPRFLVELVDGTTVKVRQSDLEHAT